MTATYSTKILLLTHLLSEFYMNPIKYQISLMWWSNVQTKETHWNFNSIKCAETQNKCQKNISPTFYVT